MPALNNVTTADGYTDATTLRCAGTRRFLLHVRNAAIYYQLGTGWPATSWEFDERFVPPGTLGRALAVDAIRVRSAAVGVPAQVTIDAVGG